MSPATRATFHALGTLYGCVATMDDGAIDQRERRAIRRRSKQWVKTLDVQDAEQAAAAMARGVDAGRDLVCAVATGRQDSDAVTRAVNQVRTAMGRAQRTELLLDLAHVVDATQRGGAEGTARQAGLLHAIRHELGLTDLSPDAPHGHDR